MSTPAITILPDDKQLGQGENWSVFSRNVVSLARGRGLMDYLTGNVVRPTAFVAGQHATPNTSRFPSAEEFDMRDGYISALIYQNVKEPEAHGLNPADSAYSMWAALHSKFNRTSDLLAGLALDRLDALTKLRSEVIHVGGRVSDTQMITILLQSLPLAEFGPSGGTSRTARISPGKPSPMPSLPTPDSTAPTAAAMDTQRMLAGRTVVGRRARGRSIGRRPRARNPVRRSSTRTRRGGQLVTQPEPLPLPLRPPFPLLLPPQPPPPSRARTAQGTLPLLPTAFPASPRMPSPAPTTTTRVRLTSLLHQLRTITHLL
ncbi:hypothetical protein DFH09DRAFT_1157298, partial [Mycena vulgaris]